jgi:hypothetical protein
VTPLRRRALCQAEPRSPAPTRQGPGSRDEQFAASLSRRMEPSRPGVDGAMRRESDRRWWIPGGGSEGERLRAAPFKPRSRALPIAPSRRRSTMRTASKHLAASPFPPRSRLRPRRPVSRDTSHLRPHRSGGSAHHPQEVPTTVSNAGICAGDRSRSSYSDQKGPGGAK